MPVDYTQKGKPMRLETPLGGDTLLVEQLSGIDAMSKPFEFTLDLISVNQAIDPKKLLRLPVCVTVDLIGGGERFFHGVVRRFSQLGRSDNFVSYRAEVVPMVWFLSLATDCRIFQQESVPDIVKKLLDERGIKDYKFSLNSEYQPRDYCVQYRESDLDFISRLLEEEGIFYFFEHTSSKHTIVFADVPATIKAGPVSKLSAAIVAAGSEIDDVLTSFEVGSAVCSGKVTVHDYNEETPALSLERSASAGSTSYSAEKYRLYDYPGKYLVAGQGDRLARIRIEETESMSRTISGSTNCRGLSSGHKLEIADHYRKDVNQPYQLVSMQHQATQAGYRSDKEVPAFEFESSFVAIPYSVSFRPARVTPKSVVHGTQTAVVVGPSGEEIYTDKYGRVKVQFFWDQLGKKDESSSCWIRVSSAWAGKNWGAIQIPRIGQEVVVDFLEGDPDRPIITGRVYNAEQMPPYDLPANGTQSGVKSRSSKSGGPPDFNEFRFEDKKGSEQVLLHAQKDFALEVENDETHSVGNDRKKTIEHDETVLVKHDRTETVNNNETITVEKDRSVTIKSGNDKLVISTGNFTQEVSVGNMTTKLGAGNVDVKTGGGAIKHEAVTSIELKVAGNSIKIDPSGITIKGMKVSIEGSIQVEVKAPMTTVKGDGMLTLKGGITMIN
ncbi:MAG TPA: type VI secretion system tip protein TssI/VgrG [Gemmatimonadaceae bacterium]|nr:type VI secretion system tip protein TssI/VgrG [Gemmatimonadaceae bacterium]